MYFKIETVFTWPDDDASIVLQLNVRRVELRLSAERLTYCFVVCIQTDSVVVMQMSTSDIQVNIEF